MRATASRGAPAAGAERVRRFSIAGEIPRLIAAAAVVLPLVACATGRPRIDVYLSESFGALSLPVEIRLRKVEILSDGIPLSAEYPVVIDYLSAIASRCGFTLSTDDRNQPYAMELTLREQTVTARLVSRSSVVAVLSLIRPADGSCPARVVFASLSNESPLSLYRLYESGEAMFAALRGAIARQPRSRLGAPDARIPADRPKSRRDLQAGADLGA